MVKSSFKRLTTPFTLGQVCLQWRFIAWADPALWNSVYLLASLEKADAQANLLEEWLSRSGNLPLLVEIDCCLDDEWSQYDGDALSLLAPVFQRSHRCRTFRTRFPPSCLLDIPCSSTNPPFSNLTNLSVVPRSLGEDEEEIEIDSFRHATGLRTLQIQEINYRSLYIQWENLVKVTANSIYADDCLSILHSAPNLELCEFESIQYPRTHPQRPIALSSLHTLLLDWKEIMSDDDLVLHNITAPNLKVLELIMQDAHEFPVEKFKGFIDRSRCQLDELSILNPSMSSPDLKACLTRVAGSVRHLHLDLQSNTPGANIVYLTPKKEVLANWLPRIESWKIGGPDDVIASAFNIILP